MATLILDQDTVKITDEALYLNGTIGAVNDVIGDTIDAINYDSVSVHLLPGWIGTVQFEGTNDPSVANSWRSISLANPSGDTAAAYQSTANTSNELFNGDLGFRYFRIRMSAFTSGTLGVRLVFSPDSTSSKPRGTQSVTGGVTAQMRPVSGGTIATTTNLAANATYTGATQDRGTDSTAWDTRVKPMFRHAAGTTPALGILQESADGTTWYEMKRIPIPSDGQWHTFDWSLHLRFWRILMTNGAVAETVNGVGWQSSRGDGSSVDVRNILTFPETAVAGVALAASATLAGGTLDLGPNHDWSTVRAVMVGDATGASLRIDQSLDGVSWFADNSATVTYNGAGIAQSVEAKVGMRYVRSRIINGANAMTGVRLTTTLVSL